METTKISIQVSSVALLVADVGTINRSIIPYRMLFDKWINGDRSKYLFTNHFTVFIKSLCSGSKLCDRQNCFVLPLWHYILLLLSFISSAQIPHFFLALYLIKEIFTQVNEYNFIISIYTQLSTKHCCITDM